MPDPVWLHFPLAAAHPQVRAWLGLLANLGRSPATVDAYGRGLEQYFRFCSAAEIDPAAGGLDQVALFVRHLNGEPGPFLPARARVSNATLQQRITALRLWHDHLVYAGVRKANPIPRGHHEPGAASAPGRPRRGLVPRQTKLPRVPDEDGWARVLARAAQDGLRNRLMFALAYFGALRREELVALRVTDLDFAHRLVRVRAENTKGGRARIVCFPESAMPSLAAYLAQRRDLVPGSGPLFLSESDRNPRQPITRWTWSKAVRRIALEAAAPEFSTHTLRHLRLTHLALAGWTLPELASYAGHRRVQTTMIYIHLSGRDLVERMARTVGHLDGKLALALLPGDGA